MDQKELENIFMDVFAEYSDAIFRFSLVKVSDPARAQDMTQEVFMRYWQVLRDGKELENTRAYLYTIANNLAKDWYKKRKSESLEAHEEAGLQPADTTELSPEVKAGYTEVLDAIAELADGDREVLLLRYVEGYEPKEIATLLDESANVVSVRLNRAMKRLQTYLHSDHG